MSIIFAGDFFYNGDKEPSITHEMLRKAIKECNAIIVNLEGPIVGENHTAIKKVGPIKHQSERCINVLKSLGMTAVTLANNHIMDGDRKGLENTIEMLNKSNIEFFGIADPLISLENPLIRLNVDGKDVSIIGAAEEEFNGPSEFGCGAFIIDPIVLWTLITRELQEERDVIVVLHGGIEYEHLPPPWLRKISHWLIDIGVTAVITHHPHVPGYVEVYKNKPIAWSLGNFWFSEGGGTAFSNRIGYAFELSFTAGGTIDWTTYPYCSDYEQGIVREMELVETKRWNDLIADIKNTLEDEKTYEQWWRRVIENKRAGYLTTYSMAPLPNVVKPVLSTLLTLFNIDSQWRLRQLNGLRCRSHREVWIQSLKKVHLHERHD